MAARVACKLQYPDMVSTVEADLRQLRVAMALYHRIDKAIQQDEVYKELAERLREELDYLREAAHLRLYRLMLADRPDISVPEPVGELSTSRLLTMSWLDGRSLQSRLDENPDEEVRNRMARALFAAWYQPLYRYGVIHGDPHMGNFQVRPDDGLNLLDFGAIRIFRPQFVQGVIDLHQAIERNDGDQALPRLPELGFRRPDAGDHGSAQRVGRASSTSRCCRTACGRSRRATIPAFGRTIAERVHAGLQKTGGVKPPREFVLIDRSAVGLGSVFLRLRARLNWHRLYHETIAGFNEQEMAARQAAALAEARVPPPLVLGTA